MNKQALSLAVFIAGAYPAASNALGLGGIESTSHLNQPLRAQIELLATAPADASKIQVRLASPDVFNRVGVARPEFLSKLHFTPSVQGGKPVILVTSDVPIQEPFVNFLLEVSWPQGQLLKEYTVMLDPPVMLQPGNTVAGSNAAVRAEPKAAGNVRRPQQTREAPAASRPANVTQAQATERSNNRSTYLVRKGDTLFRVAGRLQRSGASNEQMMMALFRANPSAFINQNINNLKAGVTLRAPSGSDIGGVSRAEARRQVRQQNAEWREFRKTLARSTVPQTAAAPVKPATDNKNASASDQARNRAERIAQAEKARLEVLGSRPGQSKASEASASATPAKLNELEKQLALARESLAARQKENDDLKSRVSDLESMLDKKGRLIDLRNEQLAGLQKQLADSGIKADSRADNLGNPAESDSTVGAKSEAGNGDDIQNHIGNTASQQSAEVLRSQPVAGSVSVTTPGNRDTSEAGQSVSAPPKPPLTPPVAVKPVTPVMPVTTTPAPSVSGESQVIPVDTSAEEENNPPASPFKSESDSGYSGLLEMLTSPQAMMLGAGALALLLLLWLLGRRRKSGDSGKAADKTRSKKTGLSADMDPPLDHVLGGEEFGLTGKSHTHDRDTYTKNAHAFEAGADDFSMDGSSAWDDLPSQPESLVTGAADTATDHGHGMQGGVEDDLLTEANVYIAYGLYQQAESELKKGIERNPDKLEYRHKLLECYFVANNREAFDRHAEQFAAMHGPNKESLWKSIVEWGRKISPDNKLYQGDSYSSAATVAAVAAGAAAVAAASHQHHEAEPDDLATDFTAHAENKHEAGNEDALIPADEDEPSDLDLGDLDFDDIDLDKLLKDEERPDSVETNASGEDDGNMALGDMHSDADELDLDFGMDELESLTAKPADTADGGVNASIVEGTAGNDDNLLDFMADDDTSGHDDALSAVETAPAVAPAEGKGVKSSSNLNLHLDNSNLNRILPKDTFYAPAGSTEGNEEEEWLGDIDDALSFLDFPDEEIDLHEAHISTKLDLARAYLDMGDIEGARSTLEEVMVEGNDDQRREAEILLHQTG